MQTTKATGSSHNGGIFFDDVYEMIDKNRAMMDVEVGLVLQMMMVWGWHNGSGDAQWLLIHTAMKNEEGEEYFGLTVQQDTTEIKVQNEKKRYNKKDCRIII